MINSFTGKPELTTAANIENDGFWPDLAMTDLMNAYRIPSEYDNVVIKDRLVLAMIEVNDRLTAIKEAVNLQGHSDLDAYVSVHSSKIDGVEILNSKYQEAVFSYAKALLLQQFKTMNRKAEAENLAKESPETEAYWLNRSALAAGFLFKKILPDAENAPGMRARLITPKEPGSYA